MWEELGGKYLEVCSQNIRETITHDFSPQHWRRWPSQSHREGQESTTAGCHDCGGGAHGKICDDTMPGYEVRLLERYHIRPTCSHHVLPRLLVSSLFPNSKSPSSSSRWQTLCQNHTGKQILRNIVITFKSVGGWINSTFINIPLPIFNFQIKTKTLYFHLICCNYSSFN